MAAAGDTPITATGTGTTSTGTGPQTATESSLSNWVGPYVTDMLGKGQALASEPYQAYQGPLTAGESTLQNKAFSGLAGLTIPTSNMGAFTPQSFTGTDATTGKSYASQYMNPYLQQALQPQLDEARRQAEISNLGNRAALTKAGAYGGSRQAIMESENQRNLGTQLAGITGKGYLDAFNNAQDQFNKEQDFGLNAQNQANQYGLSALQKQADLGATQRGIEAEGIAADKAQFDEQRDWDKKQVQYLHSLLDGLPLATQNYTYQQPSTLTQLMNSSGGILELLFGGTKPATTTTTITAGSGTGPLSDARTSTGTTGTGTGATTPTDLGGTAYV